MNSFIATSRWADRLPGGAHRDVDLMAERIREHLVSQLGILRELPLEDLLTKRYQRLMSYGN